MVCLGCSAQPTTSAPPDVVRLLERQVRSTYSVPAEVRVNIGPLRPSEFPNYDALTITFVNDSKKQDFEFLLAKDRKTLLRMTRIDLTKDPYADVAKKIDVTGRPTRGAKDAKVVAVNYDDFECPYCARMHANLFPTILKEYGDRVLFIYKDYPLDEIHPWAIHAAVDANCLAAQNTDGYWDFADYVHGNQGEVDKEYKEKSRAASNAALAAHRSRDEADKESKAKGLEAAGAVLDKLATEQGQKHNLDAAKLQACVKAQDDKAVKASQSEGDKVGVNATPAMYVNGQKIDGAVAIEDLRAVLDGALRDAGLAPPEHKPAPPEAKSAPEKPSK